MSHTFIVKVLRKFGFGERFVKWVQILYTDITSAVKVNGYLTKEFPIKRGVRQGCPLSALIYVLCAEVLGIEIRKNEKIVGYKYNRNKDEHKLTQYADDKVVCVTTDNSILELFRSLNRYEMATNSRINKDKTIGVWIGAFRNKDKDFAGIQWKDEPVESLGVFVGNDRNLCSVTGFNAVKEKIKVKMSYWSCKTMSLKGRVKVLNIFVLSKLWHILESQEIPAEILKEINTLIKDFIWKDIHQIQFDCLHERYDDGGIGLQDITLKKQALRLKWLKFLISCEKCHVENHLANVMIGNHKGIVGLKILSSSSKYDKNIMCSFYREAVKAWHAVILNYVPKNVLEIQRDWIYENILLKDDDGRVFKPPSVIHPCVPEYFCDLPVTAHPREFRSSFRNLIPQINKAFMKISFSDNERSKFEIATRDGAKDISCCHFQTLYDSCLHLRKPSTKPWVAKWENEGTILSTEWTQVWENVHHPCNSQIVQSSLWELIHRYYMCSYFAKVAFNEDGVCKLCHTVEMERIHIFMTCPVINELYKSMSPLLMEIFPTSLTTKEKAIGLKVPSKNSKEEILRNYVTSAIKHVTFRSRNHDYGGFERSVTQLKVAIRNFVKNDLTFKWILAVDRNRTEAFKNLYFQRDILGTIDCNNDVVFYDII